MEDGSDRGARRDEQNRGVGGIGPMADVANAVADGTCDGLQKQSEAKGKANSPKPYKLDPQLKAIVDAWQTLPAAARAMVEATKGQ